MRQIFRRRPGFAAAKEGPSGGAKRPRDNISQSRFGRTLPSGSPEGFKKDDACTSPCPVRWHAKGLGVCWGPFGAPPLGCLGLNLAPASLGS
eukprot:1427803-Pyramimonas_sp.AAC.1